MKGENNWSASKQASIRQAAGWCLRVGTALVCLGLAQTWQTDGSPVGPWLSGLGTAIPAFVYALDDNMPWLFVFAAGVVIARPVWPVTLFIGLWTALAVTAAAMTAGTAPFYTPLSPAAGASQILGPIALAMLVSGFAPADPVAPLWCGAAHWILRIAAAVTFVWYGLEALMAQPVLVDMLIGALVNLVPPRFNDTAAVAATYAIVGGHFLAALLVLLTRWRIVPIWMVLWALAASGGLAMLTGAERWADALRGALDVGVPLSLLVLWAHQMRSPAGATHELGRVAGAAAAAAEAMFERSSAKASEIPSQREAVPAEIAADSTDPAHAAGPLAAAAATGTLSSHDDDRFAEETNTGFENAGSASASPSDHGRVGTVDYREKLAAIAQSLREVESPPAASDEQHARGRASDESERIGDDFEACFAADNAESIDTEETSFGNDQSEKQDEVSKKTRRRNGDGDTSRSDDPE